MNDATPGVSEVELQALADEYGLLFLRDVTDDMLDAALVRRLPVEWARTNGVLPVRFDGDVCVLTSNPGDVRCQEDLALLIGEDLRPLVAPADVIAHSIERCYVSREDSPRDFLDDLDAGGVQAAERGSRADDLLSAAQEAPVSQLVNLILLEALKRGASDIHFEPFESRLRVRYRVDGVLYEQASPPKHLEESLVSRLKVMAHMDIAEKRLPQDGMARVRVGEREVDVRVSTVPVAEGERVVLRLLDRASALLPLTALGMESGLSAFRGLLRQPNGMVIVSGPTGSGKTTTLYAALGELDSDRRNILTIEDPVEYQLPNIGQIQVKPKIGLTFATGLRHILRQDPDVVLVGETRDVETAQIALRASLTGHLVFTTLHTNDACGAVVRLLDMGTEPYLLASCLRGVLAQRLVRRLCDACRVQTVPESAALARLEGAEAALLTPGTPVWSPTGCDACLEGYKGRAGLFELLVASPEIEALVRSGPSGAEGLRRIALAAGMRSLVEDGLQKVLQGVTSLNEVLGAAAS